MRVQYTSLISFIVALHTFEKLFWIMYCHVLVQISLVRCRVDAMVAFVEVRSNIFPGHFIVLITEIVILIELWHIVLWSKLVRLWSITYFSSKYESDQTAIPLPLYYLVLHLYLCWLLVVNFFDEHCRKLPSILLQLPTLPTLSIHCPLPQKALSAPLFFSSLPGALLCAHTSLALPFPPLRILGPTMGTTGHPTIQHYLYDGVSVKYY